MTDPSTDPLADASTSLPAAPAPTAPPCDLAHLPTKPLEDRVKKAFHDAWGEFFGPTGRGPAFKVASQADQMTIAKDYMGDLPKVEGIPSSVAPGIAARGWFACYLGKLANGDHAGAEEIRKTFD